MKLTDSQQVVIKSGFLVLIAFAILKPMSLMGRANLSIGVLEITDIVGVGISYLLILPLLAGLKQVKLDLFSLIILTFIFYTIQSIFWGSEIRNIAQLIVPFIVFFSVRTFITQTDDAKILIIFLVLGFIVPIAFSTFNIAMGRSIHAIEWRHEMPRFAGAFPGSHTLSYAMLFFTFFYCILHHMYRIRNSLNRIIIGFFLILSAYCLYKSLTRTAMVGFVLFWFIYLWGTNKRAFLVAVVASAIGLIVFFNHIHIIIFKQEDKIDFNVATSGRVELVKGNINLFLESSLTQQLVGRGLGHKARFSFHNDYIALLMQLGVIGLLLYLILIFYLLLDIFLCKEEKTIYLFGAIFISVAAMNFGSNAIIFRVEFSQYFWCIMGFFYFIKKNKTSEYETKENYPRNY